jgi:hypothetical protein
MTCGDAYRYLLVTEDGKTPLDPWDWYPGPLDYDEWRDVARKIDREVFRQWHWLLAVEDKIRSLPSPPVDAPYPERDRLRQMLADFAAKVAALSHPAVELVTPGSFTWEPDVRQAIEAGEAGTCVLEELDAAVAYYKHTPLLSAHPKKGPPKKPSWLKQIAVVGVLGGGLYWWRKRKR